VRLVDDDRTVRHPLLNGDLTAVAAAIAATAVGGHTPAFVPIASIVPNIAVVVMIDANRYAAVTDGNANLFGDCRDGGQQDARCGKTYQDFVHFGIVH
jgi:hypothetical protein